MGTQDDLLPVNWALAALADRQWGVVTRDQLISSGLSAHGIHERVRSRRLIRLHRGVYAIGHRRLRRSGHLLAAVLACGRRSGAFARGCGGAVEHPGKRGDVDRRDRAFARMVACAATGIRIHRSGRLGADEATTKDGIPVTTVARTLLDLADVLNNQAEEGDRRGRPLFDALTAPRTQPGKTRQHTVEGRGRSAATTRSESRIAFAFCAATSPAPRQPDRAGYEVDAFWPDANLIVELDGYAAHGTRGRSRRPRARPPPDRRRLPRHPPDSASTWPTGGPGPGAARPAEIAHDRKEARLAVVSSAGELPQADSVGGCGRSDRMPLRGRGGHLPRGVRGADDRWRPHAPHGGGLGARRADVHRGEGRPAQGGSSGRLDRHRGGRLLDAGESLRRSRHGRLGGRLAIRPAPVPLLDVYT